MKIVINKRYGGFRLSYAAEDLYCKLKYGHKPFRYEQVDGDWHKKVENPKEDAWSIITLTQDHGDNLTYDSQKEQGWWYYGDIERNDPILVKTIEELGEKANGRFSTLEVVEIPDDIQWKIDEYDGLETVHEVHRSW